MSAHGTQTPIRGGAASWRATSGAAADAGEVEGQLAAHAVQRLANTVLTRDDPRAGRIVDPCCGERGLGDLDLEPSETVAGREERLLSSVAQQEYRPVARDASSGGGRREQRLGRRALHALVGDGHGRHAEAHGEGPRDVVVRQVRRLRRKALRRQDVHGVVAVRLVQLHDVAAARVRPLGDGQVRREPPHLDVLVQQPADHPRHAQRVGLPRGDHEGVRLFRHALPPRVVSGAVEVAQHLLRMAGGPVQDREGARLLVVRVVAHRPTEMRGRRRRAIPLAGEVVFLLAASLAQRARERLGRGVPVGLVAAADGVVVHGHRVQVVLAEPLAEVPGPHTGHPHRRHRRHLVEAHLEELAGDDGVEVRVVGAGAVPRLEQGDRLVEVVDHRRVVLVEHVVDGTRHAESLLVGVAVDVDVHVLVPVRRRLAGQRLVVGLPFQVAVEPVGHLVATVGLRDRVDQDHHVLPDGLDHRLLRDGQPVRQLHPHLGAAGLVGVETAVEVVDRAGASDDPLGLLRVRAARVRERRGRCLEALEIADARLVGDGHEDDLAPLLGLADGLDVDAWRGRGQRADIRLDLGGVGQLACGPDDVAEEARGRRHRRGRGNVGHPRVQEARLGREAGDGLDRPGLRRVGRVGRVGGEGRRRDRKGCHHEHPGAPHCPPPP